MPYDKKWHMILSAAACLFLGLLLPILTAAGITLVFGVGKEIVYDKWMGRGTPEWLDFLADVLGVAAACVVYLGFIGGAL